jgi:uncharacterized phage protein gp47/JayE
MPFARPTVQDLITRIQTDVESRLPGSDARLRRNLLYVLARVQAGAVHGLYGHLDWLARQILPDTADAEYLARWADIWGITRLAAVAATGDVTITGTTGAVIPAGTALQASDGTAYTTDAEATLAAGTATAAVTADTAGSAGTQDAGVTLSLVSPISGVNSQATVAAGGLAGGADSETDTALRARLLARIQQPPHGGAAADYIAWALEAHPDVTDAWAYPAEAGLGTVTVRLMTYGATADGIPTQTVIDAVQAHIDTVRPVTAVPYALGPVAVPFDVTISGITPNTQAVKDAVEAEIADLLLRAAEPGGTILVSQLREAISIAADETDHVLVSPVADVTHATGEIATMGTVTWS